MSWNVEVLGLASDASQSDFVLLFALVFSHILLGTLEDLGSLLLLLLLVQDEGTSSGSSSFSILLALLQQSLGDLWKTSGCWLLSSCRFLSAKSGGRRRKFVNKWSSHFHSGHFWRSKAESQLKSTNP